MRKGFPMLVAVLVLAVSGTAYAYDCIRVSSSPQPASAAWTSWRRLRC